MKSGGAHVSTSCYLYPSLLYTMHTLRFREREKETVPWTGQEHVWTGGEGAELRDGAVQQVDVLEESDG